MSLKGAIGKKCGMTQVFAENGEAVPVTVIELFPMTVTQVKTIERDGYAAVQVGYWNTKEKHVNKPRQGFFKKFKLGLFRRLKEFRVDQAQLAQFSVGQEVDPAFLNDTPRVNVRGRSIGKGFQGRIRLHNFARGPMSHGSKSHRLPGSIGAGTTPGRVFKGLKMAAHMGDKNRTVQNLKIFKYDASNKLLLVQGSVPGKPGAIVEITPRRTVGRK